MMCLCEGPVWERFGGRACDLGIHQMQLCTALLCEMLDPRFCAQNFSWQGLYDTREVFFFAIEKVNKKIEICGNVGKLKFTEKKLQNDQKCSFGEDVETKRQGFRHLGGLIKTKEEKKDEWMHLKKAPISKMALVDAPVPDLDKKYRS